MAKTTKIQAQEIIDKFMSGVGKTQLASEHHIGITTVWNILHGVTWKECHRPDNIQELIDMQRTLRSGSKCKELPQLTDLQNDVLIGSLLGDGSLHKTNANSYFSKLQMQTKKSYLDWHFEIFSQYSRRLYPVFSKKKLTTNSDGTIGRIDVPKYLCAYHFYTFRHPNFTELRKKWYPKGIKIIPPDLELNPQRIAIWFFDDGTNSIKHNRSATISTNSFTLDEVELLKHKLEEFDLFPAIKMNMSKTKKKTPMLDFYGRSYDNLIAIIKPYMLWNCFAYKTEWRPAKKQWEYSGKLTEAQVKEIIKIGKTKNQKQTAKDFNISRSTVNRIVNHKGWKHLI